MKCLNKYTILIRGIYNTLLKEYVWKLDCQVVNCKDIVSWLSQICSSHLTNPRYIQKTELVIAGDCDFDMPRLCLAKIVVPKLMIYFERDRRLGFSPWWTKWKSVKSATKWPKRKSERYIKSERERGRERVLKSF